MITYFLFLVLSLCAAVVGGSTALAFGASMSQSVCVGMVVLTGLMVAYFLAKMEK